VAGPDAKAACDLVEARRGDFEDRLERSRRRTALTRRVARADVRLDVTGEMLALRLTRHRHRRALRHGKTRELLTFSMLAALGGAEPQLKGHIEGDLNVGNDKEKLISVVTSCCHTSAIPER
jgi:alkylhydroperoxidase/carboxymuconolactone decarboxylase family protein YurZ